MKHYKKSVINPYNNKQEIKILNAYAELQIPLDEVDFVFVKKNGVYEGTDSCKYPFKVIHYELGIPCRFHDFRDTHATKLIESGADIKAVSKRLGHRNIDFTYNIYVRVTQKMESETADKFEEICGTLQEESIMKNELPKTKIDERTGIEYRLEGDYYIPNLTLPKQETIILNKYGRMRLNYLKEHKKAEYSIMLLDGTLSAHLKEIQETAQNKVEQIINKLKAESDLTEEMKDTDILYWVGTMNAIKNQAEEIVFNELIYVQEECNINNLREVKDDLLKEWIEYREETIFAIMNEEDKKHEIRYDEITEKILKNVPKQNQKYVRQQLDVLDRNYMEYLDYWCEKYYRNGFADVIELFRM